MSLFVVDTDTLSLYDGGHPVVIQNIVAHGGHRLAITVTTVDELVSGWQTAIRRGRTDAQVAHAHARLAAVLELMAGWEIRPMTVPAIVRHTALLRLKTNVKSNDLRIAAVALEAGAIVVTRNSRDFSRVPGLSIVDWSV